MSIRATYFSRTFHFGFEARTSRGSMADKTSWFVALEERSNPGVKGIGECGPLPGLSLEDIPGMNETLKALVLKITNADWHLNDFGDTLATVGEGLKRRAGKELLEANSALAFALETAILDLRLGGRKQLFDNSFYNGTPIPINGLVWMGSRAFMEKQVGEKIAQGYTCIKIKVGGEDFDAECALLRSVREMAPAITLRLDANGAFKSEDVLSKLSALAEFNIHSIEQPLHAGHPDLAGLSRQSPIPVALDEELIGVRSKDQKMALLEKVRPAFIILKPTLHGGLTGCAEWIQLAEERSIGWWNTSALESSVGLNAVSQFTAEYDVRIPQGLGTGAIYLDNVPSPLVAEKGFLSYKSGQTWSLGNNN